MSANPPDHISRITPYQPGKTEDDVPTAGGSEKPLKLASNENPLGPSPRAVAAARQTLDQCHRYPDGSGRLLREALSRRLRLPGQQILLGNGSTELVELLARTFLGRDGWAVMARQSFPMYRLAVMAVNGHCREVPLRNSRHDLIAMAQAADKDTLLLYIANPNNPTGTYVTAGELEEYFRQVPDSVITVLDEAYAEYLDLPDYPSGLESLRRGRRLVVLRTFSKAYGLAGLRIGYALAPENLVSEMEKIRSPFNTSRVAQAAALAALDDEEHLARSRNTNRTGLRILEQELRLRGVSFTSSVANFVLVHFGRPSEEVYQALLREGIITRPMTQYGFPEALRITVGAEGELRRFLGALDRVLAALPAREL